MIELDYIPLFHSSAEILSLRREGHNHSPLPLGEGRGEGKIEWPTLPRPGENGCNRLGAVIGNS